MYYFYLMSLCEGLFAKSEIHFEVKDGVFEIRKKGGEQGEKKKYS